MREYQWRLVSRWLRGKRHPLNPPFGGLAGAWVQLFFGLTAHRRRKGVS